MRPKSRSLASASAASVKICSPSSRCFQEVYDRVDRMSQRGEEIMGVPTGLIDLDRLFGGLQKSDLLIVAGRPGMGKTGFMLSIAKNAGIKA